VRILHAALAAALGLAGLQTWRLERLRADHAVELLDSTSRAAAAERDEATRVAGADVAAVTQRDAIDVRLAAAAAAGQRLRQRAEAAERVAAAASAGGSCDATPAGGVPADVPDRLDAAGRELAAFAERLEVALTACRAGSGHPFGGASQGD
jgi:hypothetical protein